MTREDIKQLVWAPDPGDDRLLDIHMSTLRKKLKGFNHKIETVYGTGYVIKTGSKEK